MAALELAKHKIRVNVVCPGKVGTAIEQHMEKRNISEIELPVKFERGTIPLVCSKSRPFDKILSLRSKSVTPHDLQTDGKPGNAEDVAEMVY